MDESGQADRSEQEGASLRRRPASRMSRASPRSRPLRSAGACHPRSGSRRRARARVPEAIARPAMCPIPLRVPALAEDPHGAGRPAGSREHLLLEDPARHRGNPLRGRLRHDHQRSRRLARRRRRISPPSPRRAVSTARFSSTAICSARAAKAKGKPRPDQRSRSWRSARRSRAPTSRRSRSTTGRRRADDAASRLARAPPHRLCERPGHEYPGTRALPASDGLRRLRLPFDPALVIPGDYTLESGVTAGAALLAPASRPSAVFCTSDEMAIGLMRTLSSPACTVPRRYLRCRFRRHRFAAVARAGADHDPSAAARTGAGGRDRPHRPAAGSPDAQGIRLDTESSSATASCHGTEQIRTWRRRRRTARQNKADEADIGIKGLVGIAVGIAAPSRPALQRRTLPGAGQGRSVPDSARPRSLVVGAQR